MRLAQGAMALFQTLSVLASVSVQLHATMLERESCLPWHSYHIQSFLNLHEVSLLVINELSDLSNVAISGFEINNFN